MVSNSTNDRHLSEALRVGVRGYLLQQATVGDVVLAILGATTGHTILAPSLAQRLLVSKPAVMREHISEHATLSGRELDVVRHLAEGLTNAEIARALTVGEATVKTHVSSLLCKLDLRTRSQVVAYAFKSRLVPVEVVAN